jgi:hypothetical protein
MALAAALILLLGVASPVRAAPPSPFSLEPERLSISTIIKQLSPNGRDCDPAECVVNPWIGTPDVCAWDYDDVWRYRGAGKLASQSSVSASICHVAYAGDAVTVLVSELLLWSSSPGLVIQIEDGLGTVSQADVSRSGKDYVYLACSYDSIPGPFPEIEGSNGGHGTPIQYAVTISNPTSKSITVDNAAYSYGGAPIGHLCPYPWE